MQRKRFLSLILLTLAALAVTAGERHFVRNVSQVIDAEPLPLDSTDPERNRTGSLTYLGGWELKSDNNDFGGFSALSRLPDGRFLAISDSGHMAGFRLSQRGKVTTIIDSFVAQLPGAYARGPDGKVVGFEERDSESITSDPGYRHYWVGYENHGAIRRFNADFMRVSAMVRPPEMKPWPDNGGAEAMVRLADGRFLVFSEARESDIGGTEALLYSGDPTRPGVAVRSFAYLAPQGFRITDAAQLPDGRLLLLHRRLSFPDGFTAVLAIADPDDAQPGALMRSKEIARFEPPLTVDNMEGLLVEDVQGRTIIWLISDDNHMLLQRTLLLKFAYGGPVDEAEERSGSAAPGFASQ